MFRSFPPSFIVYLTLSGTPRANCLENSKDNNFTYLIWTLASKLREDHVQRRLPRGFTGTEFSNPSAVPEVGIQITDGVDLKNAFLIAEKLA